MNINRLYEPLDIDLIKQSTQSANISYFDSIDSTNSYLLGNGRCNDICISEMQTNGRGRRGNTWVSQQTGNIYFSQCWCFAKTTKFWSLLGLLTGIAIAEALQDVGLKGHGVKWPNDIYWRGKKLGGILLEAPDQSGKVIIGIGLNINMMKVQSTEIDQPYVSLCEAMDGQQFSRNLLVIALINRLNDNLEDFINFDDESFSSFKGLWKKWDILQGKSVSFENQGQMITGEVLDIDENGCLGILTSKGVVDYFSSADIRLSKGQL